MDKKKLKNYNLYLKIKKENKNYAKLLKYLVKIDVK
jgi:hypothetical protein